MPTQHVSRVRQYLDSGATIQNSSGDLEAGGGGSGAGLRAFAYTLTPAAGGKTVQVSLQVKNESGAQVAHTTHFRFDLFDDYLINSGFSATALVGNASAGVILNTSAGGTAYPSHFGYTTAGGTVTFNVWPSMAAMAAQNYTLVAFPVSRAATPPTWAVQPLTVAFTCTP